MLKWTVVRNEDVYMDSPNDVTSGPSCTTVVSPSSPKNIWSCSYP